MTRLLACFVSGAIFAAGLNLAGMTSTRNVRAFLDLFGDWDPRLALVMLGALSVVIPGERLLKRKKPMLAAEFEAPAQTSVDNVLLAGAALFGIGWGLVGLCPGPLVVVLGSFRRDPWLFALAMVLGMAVADGTKRLRAPATTA